MTRAGSSAWMPVVPRTLNSANDRSSARRGQIRLPSQQAREPRGTEMIAGLARVMGGCGPGQTPGLGAATRRGLRHRPGHAVASLVMMSRVATCRAPVTPAE